MNPFFLNLMAAAVTTGGVSASDLSRFPDQHQARACWNLTKQHQQFADGRRHALRGCQWSRDVAAELAWRERCWDELYNATIFYSPGIKEHHLRGLRHLIGAEAYAGGRMPCPLPLHLYGDATGTRFPRELLEEPAEVSAMGRLP